MTFLNLTFEDIGSWGSMLFRASTPSPEKSSLGAQHRGWQEKPLMSGDKQSISTATCDSPYLCTLIC